MTGIAPYQGSNELQVVLALSRGRPPAVLPEIPSNEQDQESSAVSMFIAVRVLHRCWQKVPSSRPTALWCSEVLRHLQTRLSDVYFKNEDPSTVPLEYRNTGSNWTVIYSPDHAEIHYTIEQTGGVREIPSGLWVRLTSGEFG